MTKVQLTQDGRKLKVDDEFTDEERQQAGVSDLPANKMDQRRLEDALKWYRGWHHGR